MTETVSIPPLVSGVTIYKTWKQSTVDKLKELKLGALFRFPDRLFFFLLFIRSASA